MSHEQDFITLWKSLVQHGLSFVPMLENASLGGQHKINQIMFTISSCAHQLLLGAVSPSLYNELMDDPDFVKLRKQVKSVR